MTAAGAGVTAGGAGVTAGGAGVTAGGAGVTAGGAGMTAAGAGMTAGGAGVTAGGAGMTAAGAGVTAGGAGVTAGGAGMTAAGAGVTVGGAGVTAAGTRVTSVPRTRVLARAGAETPSFPRKRESISSNGMRTEGEGPASMRSPGPGTRWRDATRSFDGMFTERRLPAGLRGISFPPARLRETVSWDDPEPLSR